MIIGTAIGHFERRHLPIAFLSIQRLSHLLRPFS